MGGGTNPVKQPFDTLLYQQFEISLYFSSMLSEETIQIWRLKTRAFDLGSSYRDVPRLRDDAFFSWSNGIVENNYQTQTP